MEIPFVLFEYRQRYGIEGICSNATYKNWAEGFENIYQKYKDKPLMVNQDWYPGRAEKYLKLQKLADKKKISPIIYEGLKMLSLQDAKL